MGSDVALCFSSAGDKDAADPADARTTEKLMASIACLII
jgi:hypothetical protein